MKKNRILMLVLVMVLVMTVFTGCSENESVAQERSFTDTTVQRAQDSQGMPTITNFFERGMVLELIELRDDPSLLCYYYLWNAYSGRWVYQGKCIGYGIPHSTQVTNPEQATGLSTEEGATTISQAEPNALYSTPDTTATWILALNADGEVKPRYMEQEVYVTQDKVERILCDETVLPADYDGEETTKVNVEQVIGEINNLNEQEGIAVEPTATPEE